MNIASKIKLIVSGSSAFYLDKKFKDSLAGRKKIFDVRTLSFREFLYFKGQNKFLNLDFNKLSLIETDGLKMSFEEFVIYGGYPKVVLTEDTNEKNRDFKRIGIFLYQKRYIRSRN